MIRSRRFLCILFAAFILILASCVPDPVVPEEDTTVDPEKLLDEMISKKGEDCENIESALATEMKAAYAKHINSMKIYSHKEFTADDMWV